MTSEKIYQNLGELLWRIMPNNAVKIIYRYMFYPSHSQGGAYWIDRDGQECHFDDHPIDIYDEISSLLELLSKEDIFNNDRPNHFYVCLDEYGCFNIKFAYVEESDSWKMLYMKGISDLTREEAEEYCIPLEVWKERVHQKKLNS